MKDIGKQTKLICIPVKAIQHRKFTHYWKVKEFWAEIFLKEFKLIYLMSSVGYQNVVFDCFDEQLPKGCSCESLGSRQDYKTWVPRYLSWKWTLEQISF